MTIEAGKFILAVLSEDSDIVANAFEGRGGNISARAQLVRGFRQFENVRTPESDFIASSELGIDGTVDIDTEEQLEQSLPEVPVDPTRAIDRACQAVRDDKLSRFIITGRGGFPASPTEPLSSDAIVSEWVTLDVEEESREEPTQEVTQTNSEGLTSGEIVEAQGWLVDEQGRVVLTASAPTVTPYQGQQILTECSAALSKESMSPTSIER
jgi:large exoprotein involved in heme utilization and adhesion